MATIVNTPGTNNSSGVAGWIVAGVIIIAVVLVAIFVWPGFGRGGNTAPAPTQVNVQIPALDNSGGMEGAGGNRGDMGGGAAQ